MAAPAVEKVKEPPVAVPVSHRFALADLSTCGRWLVPRLVDELKLPETYVGAWLRNYVDSNEHLFLAAPASDISMVVLFERRSDFGLEAATIVRERFVLVADPEDRKLVTQAAFFYDDAVRWAKSLGCKIVEVENLTDVPHEAIAVHLGRLYTRQQTFARI